MTQPTAASNGRLAGSNGAAPEVRPTREHGSIEILTELNVEQITLPIIGRTPLIMHRFGEKSIRQIEAKQQGEARTKRAPKNPSEEYESSFYSNDQGEIVFPASAFKNALLDACRQVDGIKATVVAGAIQMCDEWVRIYGSPKMAFHMARNATGVADTRYRPQFDQWCAFVKLDYNANVVTKEQVVNLMDQAGFSCGIGDWRPFSKTNRSGNFGRFRVVNATNSALASIMKHKQSTKAPKKAKTAKPAN